MQVEGCELWKTEGKMLQSTGLKPKVTVLALLLPGHFGAVRASSDLILGLRLLTCKKGGITLLLS